MVAVVLLEDAVLGIAGDEAAVARLDRVPQRRRATGRLGRARDVLVVVQVLGVADRQRGRQGQNRTWPAPRRTPRRREARRGPQTGARSRARPRGPWRAQIGGRRGTRAHGSRADSRGSLELRRGRTGRRHAASGSEAQFRANSNRCDEDREPDQPDPRHRTKKSIGRVVCTIPNRAPTPASREKTRAIRMKRDVGFAEDGRSAQSLA